MRIIPFVFTVLMLSGCPNPAVPTPSQAADSTFCAAMCAHLGPEGLDCPEGKPIYDSALPGDAGVPNESCTDFCVKQEKNGVFLNPKCVAKATSCADIEPSRQRVCN